MLKRMLIVSCCFCSLFCSLIYSLFGDLTPTTKPSQRSILEFPRRRRYPDRKRLHHLGRECGKRQFPRRNLRGEMCGRQSSGEFFFFWLFVGGGRTGGGNPPPRVLESVLIPDTGNVRQRVILGFSPLLLLQISVRQVHSPLISSMNSRKNSHLAQLNPPNLFFHLKSVSMRYVSSIVRSKPFFRPTTFAILQTSSGIN